MKMDVLVMWHNGVQNVVSSADLRNVGTNWRKRKKPCLEVGARVKMWYINKWWFGNVLFVDKANSKSSSGNLPSRKIKKNQGKANYSNRNHKRKYGDHKLKDAHTTSNIEEESRVSLEDVPFSKLKVIRNKEISQSLGDNPLSKFGKKNEVSLLNERDEEAVDEMDKEPKYLVAKFEQQKSTGPTSRMSEVKVDNYTTVSKNIEIMLAEEAPECVEISVMKEEECYIIDEEDSSQEGNLNIVVSEPFTLNESDFIETNSVGDKRKACNEGLESENNSKRPTLEHVNKKESKISPQLTFQKPVTKNKRDKHRQFRDLGNGDKTYLNTVKYSGYLMKPCSVHIETNIASLMKPTDIYKVNQVNKINVTNLKPRKTVVKTDRNLRSKTPTDNLLSLTAVQTKETSKQDFKEVKSTLCIKNKSKLTYPKKELVTNSTETFFKKATPSPENEMMSSVVKNSVETLFKKAIPSREKEMMSSVIKHSAETLFKKAIPSPEKEIKSSVVKNSAETLFKKAIPSPEKEIMSSVVKNTAETLFKKATPSPEKKIMSSVVKNTAETLFKKATPSPEKEMMSSVVKHSAETLFKKAIPSPEKEIMPSVVKNSVETLFKKAIPSPEKEMMSSVVKNSAETLFKKATPSPEKEIKSSVVKNSAETLFKKATPSPEKEIMSSVVKNTAETLFKKATPSPEKEMMSSVVKNSAETLFKKATPTPEKEMMSSVVKNSAETLFKKATPSPEEEMMSSVVKNSAETLFKKATPSQEKEMMSSVVTNLTETFFNKAIPSPEKEMTSSVENSVLPPTELVDHKIQKTGPPQSVTTLATKDVIKKNFSRMLYGKKRKLQQLALKPSVESAKSLSPPVFGNKIKENESPATLKKLTVEDFINLNLSKMVSEKEYMSLRVGTKPPLFNSLVSYQQTISTPNQILPDSSNSLQGMPSTLNQTDSISPKQVLNSTVSKTKNKTTRKKESLTSRSSPSKNNRSLTTNPQTSSDLTVSLETSDKCTNKKPGPPRKTNKHFYVNLSKTLVPNPDTLRNLNPTLSECLDGAPPFIREVFNCENIRNGFIDADLIFVLSLVPDMEEMTDSQRINFQLKVIETLNDVLNDPQLQIQGSAIPGC